MKIFFAEPYNLFLLFILIPVIVWYILKIRKSEPSMSFSSIAGLMGMQDKMYPIIKHVVFAIRCLILILIILILAKPQSTNKFKNISTEGIDIVMALDISGSMLARDFSPDRLEAAKKVAAEFINGRPNDRVGLVVFSGESFTQCPLTTDHAALLNLMNNIKSGIIEDGTAIGNGLTTAISRIKESKAISKVIILLTDGVNNRGSISPLTAAEIADTLNIRVYTIGVGSMGTAPYPVQTPYGIQFQNVPVEIDEAVLKQISKKTGGKYFRATNNNKLREVYQEIDKMEKSKIEVSEVKRFEEEYKLFGFLALILLISELLIRLLYLRSIP